MAPMPMRMTRSPKDITAESHGTGIASPRMGSQSPVAS